MFRHALLVAPFLLFGCATPNPSPSIVGDEARFSVTEALPANMSAAPAAATVVFPNFAVDSQTPPAAPPRTPRQRFSIKGGYYG